MTIMGFILFDKFFLWWKMIRLNNIKADLNVDIDGLKNIASMKTGLDLEYIKSVKVAKKSVDARNKTAVCFVYSLDMEVRGDETYIFSILAWKDAELLHDGGQTVFKPRFAKTAMRPVVVGTGPAGMFAGLALAEAGLNPILLERGREVDLRRKDVNRFWDAAELDESSNVQFGEGGAGTFSDGKLMTGIKKTPYMAKVLNTLAEAGAPEEILYLAKPHIGTDKLVTVVRNIRRKIVSLGGEYRFETCLTGLTVENGAVKAVRVQNGNGSEEEILTDKVILAVGHSARDTFQMLYDSGVQIEQKPFSVGVRIEHRQEWINQAQYGRYAGHPALGAADYKLAVHYPTGRSAYTFCMCPGGCVVAAASEKGRVVTNGMSEFARNKTNANAALLVGITPEDFGGSHPLQGMYFQRQLEEKAFKCSDKPYYAPAQLVGDFLAGRASTKAGTVEPSYRPGVVWTDLVSVLPGYVVDTLRRAILDMDKKLKGFAHPEAVMTAVETRSSSPIRIVRDENFESNIKGLYPCGEGAGYAGGIVSSAVDGLRVCLKI